MRPGNEMLVRTYARDSILMDAALSMRIHFNLSPRWMVSKVPLYRQVYIRTQQACPTGNKESYRMAFKWLTDSRDD